MDSIPLTFENFTYFKAPFSNDENVIRLLSSPEHREAIGKLLGPEREYFHGFNSGLLAAARMYKEHARMPTPDKMEVCIPNQSEYFI